MFATGVWIVCWTWENECLVAGDVKGKGAASVACREIGFMIDHFRMEPI